MAEVLHDSPLCEMSAVSWNASIFQGVFGAEQLIFQEATDDDRRGFTKSPAVSPTLEAQPQNLAVDQRCDPRPAPGAT